MSSPKVLTFSNAPHAEARSSNEREIAYYLALVSGVEARLRARLATLTVRGISLGLDFSTEALRCEVLPLPSGADGSEQLRRVHAAWLEIKHDRGDAIDAAFFDSEEREANENTAAVREATKALVQTFRHRAGRRIVARNAADDVIEAELEGLARAGCADIATLRAEVENLVLHTSAAQLAIGLRTLRMSYEEKSRHTRARQVRARIDIDRAEETRLECTARITMLREQLEILDEAAEARLRSELLQIQADSSSSSLTALEAKLDAVRDTIARERQRAAMDGVIRKTLRRLGYEEVTIMQTITPANVRDRKAMIHYFRDPQDSQRFVELAFADGDALSVEVVRADANIDSSQRGRDAIAQKRLCDAMKHVERAAGEAFSISVVHDAAPGIAAGVRAALSTTSRAAAEVKRMQS